MKKLQGILSCIFMIMGLIILIRGIADSSSNNMGITVGLLFVGYGLLRIYFLKRGYY